MATSSAPQSLVIIGVTKGGTTSLFNYLAQHPDICAERHKEFQSLAPVLAGQDVDPRATFDVQFGHCHEARYLLEAAPSYFAAGPVMVEAIRDRLPSPRLVLTLRDPVDRLWSAYRMKRAKGHLPPGSFDAFVERAQRVADERDVAAPEDGIHETVRTGRYADFLEPWLTTFGDRMRVVFFEQWTRDPVRTLTDLQTWLGLPVVPPSAEVLATTHNAGAMHRRRWVRRSSLWLHRRTVLLTRRHPAVKRRLMDLYGALNTQGFDETLDAERRAELHALFDDSSRRLGVRLREAGMEDLPSWVAPARTG